ncbi:MAG: hypothetical protein AB7H97_18930, partial [Pseudobdellovibrionaceae bacterium]
TKVLSKPWLRSMKTYAISICRSVTREARNEIAVQDRRGASCLGKKLRGKGLQVSLKKLGEPFSTATKANANSFRATE